MVSAEVLVSAFLQGILVGGLYALIALGLSLVWGLVRFVNLAHVGFTVVSAYAVFVLNAKIGVDPSIAGAILSPFFFLLGYLLFIVCNKIFERGKGLLGSELVFFFSLLIILEMIMFMLFGIDDKSIYTYYSMQSISIGFLNLPLRLIYPFISCLCVVIALHYFTTRTRLGIALRGVGLDEDVIAAVGCNPLRIKSLIFGLALATASLAGGFLMATQPINPFSGRNFIGIAFAVSVIGGMGSVLGAFLGGCFIGVLESTITVLFGAIWGVIISFVAALVLLLIRPKGILGR